MRSTPAAKQAIVNAGLQDKVYSTGFALPSSIKEFLNKGDAKAFALWDPSVLGYIATDVAYQLATGKITSKQGQVVATKYGKFTVGKDGEIDFNKPLIFTKSNVSQYNF